MTSTIKVDLLKPERARFRIDPLVIILGLLVISANLGYAFYGQQLTARIEARQAEVKKVQDEKRQIEASLPVIEERRTRIKKLDEQIVTIKNLAHDPIRYANILREVAFRLPPNVWLSTLSIEPGSDTVQLSGFAAQTEGRLPISTVADLLKSLNSSKYFRDASLASTAAGTGANGNTGFSWQVTVHYDEQAATTVVPGSAQ